MLARALGVRQHLLAHFGFPFRIDLDNSGRSFQQRLARTPGLLEIRRVVLALAHLHGDPENPVPAASGHALLGELPADAVSAFVQAAGPGSGSPLLAAELRQLGGALARVPEEHGALARLDAAYALFAVGIAPTPEIGAAVAGHAQALAGAMAPWATGTSYLNFAEVPTDVRSGYDEQTYARLRAVRTAVDPDGLIHANHPIDVR